MVGVSPALQTIFTIVRHVANTDVSVFVSGESGTGKELVALAIHEFSPRHEGPFVPVNCAAIPKDLLESELFGHEKGAFTGAENRRIGSCERAHKGTLFLDEICEMNVGLQSKLLRFLQEHTFTRVGGTELLEVDTRVIAATNRDPLEEVRKGRLRDDLYYRLNVVPIYISPLRDRPEDIPVLAQHFLELAGEKYNKYFVDFSPEALRMMLSYGWPGNVRELQNAIERIVVLTTADRVTPELFPEHIRAAAEGVKVPPLSVEEAMRYVHEALSRTVPPAVESEEGLPFEEIEKRAILDAIRRCNGDISKASRQLALSRATVYRKLSRYGIS
jgi:DNA-binding NtrC family response regulator